MKLHLPLPIQKNQKYKLHQSDDLQRVAVVSAHTEAIDAKTNLHENLADGSARLKDTITLNNLYYGEGYQNNHELVCKFRRVYIKEYLDVSGTYTFTPFCIGTEVFNCYRAIVAVSVLLQTSSWLFWLMYITM